MTNSLPPRPENLFSRYQELRSYVALEEEGIGFAVAAWSLVEPEVPALIDDFYEEILRHEEARRVFSGPEQVHRLKATLRGWIAELFQGNFDQAFVARRWQVGFRHVQIGLQPIWVSAAMSRLREGTLRAIRSNWDSTHHSGVDLQATCTAVSKLMDLDLALIQDAYNAESVAHRLNLERDFAEGVIQTAQAVVMVVDGAGKIIRGNAFLSRLLGWDKQGIDESNLLSALQVCDLVATAECPPLLSFLAQAAAGGTPPPLETELHPVGSAPRRVRWLARQYLAVPETSAGNRSTTTQPTALVLCVGQDITDLTEAQRQLVRQERLAAIGQTMTGLAHESRNAFQRSQAALETLLLEIEDRPAAVELIERIQRAHDHLLHLYEEVLQFARPVRLELQTLHLDAILQRTWEHLAAVAISKKVELRIGNDIAVSPLQADSFAVEQILRNVLENGVEASSPGGMIEAMIRATWIGSEPAVELSIRDHGKGLPPAYNVERIFEPFFTTRPRGTGLGLPIARRLAEGHGGSLVLLRADPGTIAVLTLPLTASPAPEPQPNLEDTRRIAGNSP